ncbi:MAG: carboxypeptidase regulatory-like domain-containing protein [Bryobacteraceae bacterium]|nr:carboxypeptidase regulatory-like domain-containing protein [Bryobacteraceae bacterium]
MHLVVCFLVALVFATFSYGQAVNGTLLGTVTDASGATVPGAKVLIAEQNTGVNRSAVTTSAGYYAFPDLQPGVYTVTVERTGFKKAVRQNVEVLVNSTMRVDSQLQTGDVTETVSVTAEAPLLQTDRSDTGRKIETQQLADMPLGTNRNFQNLLNLVPGTTRAFRPHSVFFNAQGSLSTQVNGQSRLANNVQLEGIDNNHRTGLLTALIPPVEALQTVDITTSNYEASLGRAGGAVTNVSLKSGTNEFHGSVFEFNRVSKLQAKQFLTVLKPRSTYNYFGGTIGGPIIRNKTFFFGDYLRVADRQGQNDRFNVPPTAWRNGDFSGEPQIIYDPATGNPDGSGRVPFVGNRIPANRIRPIPQKVLGLIPQPLLPGLSNNYEYNSVRSIDSDSFDAKVDHNAGDNDRLSVRYSFQRPVTFDPPSFGAAGGPHGGGFQGTGVQKAQNGAVNYNHIFSPTLITEFRAGVNRYRNDARNVDYGTKASEQIGIPGVNLDDWTSGLSQVDITGLGNPLVGYSASLPWVRAETNFNIVNQWTKTYSSHTTKWGIDFRRLRDELLQTQTYNPRGTFRYRANTTTCNAAGTGGCPGSTANGNPNAFASFLLDLPNEAGRDLAVAFPSWRQWQYFLFVHDKWQITPKLTIDAGLRWEFYQPATPRFAGGFSNYDAEKNQLLLAGIGDVPLDLGMQKNWKNFAPRFGIAYRMTERDVFRAGYGISYVPFADNTYAYNFPIKQNNGFNALNAFVPARLPDGRVASMENGFPAPIVASIPSNGIITNPSPTQVYDVINPKFREGYVQSWNFAYQRALPKNFVFEVAYVGNKGVNIPMTYNLNAGMVLGAGAAGRPYFSRYGRNVDSTMRFVSGDNEYNGLQAKFDKRYSNGFLMTTAYTWARAMANQGDDNGGPAWYINPERNWARAGFDRRQTFVQSYIYELPFGPGKKWLSSGVVSQVLGGWQVNGLLTLMTGNAINFSSTAANNAPGNAQTPNINGDFRVLGAVNDSPWFDRSVFSAPATNTFGNVGRNAGTGPNFYNLDASLFKTFQVAERYKLEFRAEAFALPNAPTWQLNNPNTNVNDANNFGYIRGAGGNRSIQLGMKLQF